MSIEKQAEFKAYASVSTKAFYDELCKMAEAIANANEEQDAPGAKETNTERIDKPIVEVETNFGTSNSVPKQMKKILSQVNAVTAQSTNGPTQGENLSATQLAGDVNAAKGPQETHSITDAATGGDVEKKAALIAKIMRSLR